MLYKEIVALCSEIQKKHRNPLGGSTVEFCDVKLCGTQSNLWGWKGQGVRDEVYIARLVGWGGWGSCSVHTQFVNERTARKFSRYMTNILSETSMQFKVEGDEN
jgi:hypothetical protein